MLRLRNGERVFTVNKTAFIKNWLFDDWNTGDKFFVRAMDEKTAFEIAEANYDNVKGYGWFGDNEAERMGLPFVE